MGGLDSSNRAAPVTADQNELHFTGMTTEAARNFDLNIEEILEGWETKHALRELIANALDEQVLTGTRNIVITGNGRNWHIRDFGRGLRYENLTQKENPEKLQNADLVIGKFGVGLKDALATLNRRGAHVRISSRHCVISLTEAPKQGFDDIITLQAAVSSPRNARFSGTDIELDGVSKADISAAKQFFLRFSGERVLDATQYGQILERSKGQDARIYVTGLLVAEEEKFAFSYNITSLTAQMSRALNRERTNVGRSAYSDRVKAMLLASKSERVASVLANDLTVVEKGTQHDEINWSDVAIHACKVLNAQKRVVFATAGELTHLRDAVDHAEGDGYRIVTIPDNVRRLLRGTKDYVGNEVRDITAYQEEWSRSFEFKFVPYERLTIAERRIFDFRDQIAQLVGGLPACVREIKISEAMRPDLTLGGECHGLWEPRQQQIIIKRCQLESLDKFAGTLLHEVTHAQTGFEDVSREFESALTAVIGLVSEACLLPD